MISQASAPIDMHTNIPQRPHMNKYRHSQMGPAPLERPKDHAENSQRTHPNKYTNSRTGFTLVESLIYIALFGLLFSGIFASMHPIFTNAERLARNIATEGETAFILTKFHYAFAHGITDTDHEITAPPEGSTDDELVISDGSTELFRFSIETIPTSCTPPRLCSFITYSEDGDDPLPLNADRIFIKDLEIKHIAPIENSPRIIEVNFIANDIPVGPIKYYLHF